MIVKTQKEIEILREGGKRLAFILSEMKKHCVPGVTSKELDTLAYKLTTEAGDKPALLKYKPYGADRPYPASICISINNEIVHGIPDDYKIKKGDVVSLDYTLTHEGLVTDAAITFAVGEVDESAKKLMEATKQALKNAIKYAVAGKRAGDIGHAIESTVTKEGFSVVRELGGHGVGHSVHEEPFIPNFSAKGQGTILKEGMVLAVEAMINEGAGEMKQGKDDYTLVTVDGKRSAHFEHTVIVGKKQAEVLTIL